LSEAQENRNDLIVVAPFDGTVMTRSAEPGEVVQAGTAIVTLLDLSKVYLRGFVPEGDIGKVKIGQPSRMSFSIPIPKRRSAPKCSALIRRPRSRRRTPTSATTA
jgi:multidrug resistance efflux pump